MSRSHRNQPQIHPYITFPQDSSYQTKFERLQSKTIAIGKKVSWNALAQVELMEPLQELFQTLPYQRIFDRTEPVFKELVLEFFSTFSLSESEVKFRIGGVFRTLTMREFGFACGIWAPNEEEEYDGALKNFAESHSQHWQVVSQNPEVPYDPQNTKASGMHPILKYLHMILAHTITARGDSNGNVTTVDLFILSHLYTHIPIDLAIVIARQAREFSSNLRKTTLGLGSIITGIARYFGVSEDTNPALTVIAEHPLPITIENMRNMHMVRKQGDRYVLAPPRRIPVPIPPAAPSHPQMTVEERLEELKQMLNNTQVTIEQIRQYIIQNDFPSNYADLLQTPPPPPQP